jgi:hypothetical protein
MTESIDKKWTKHYEKLVEFKQTNGHCAVPQRHAENLSLGAWVGNQRRKHAANKLGLDQKELLDEIGFVWKVRVANTDKIWPQQYEKLVEFQRKNGHCLVPQGYEKDVSLGTWVNTQRQMHAKNTIGLDRMGLLDEIGFVWIIDKSNKTWHQQYEKLVEFKRNNGNCLVPQKYRKDGLSLGTWVNTQRQFHGKNKLQLDRKVLLDEIGFAWKVFATGDNKRKTDKTDKSDKIWPQQYVKLVEFKRKNGHCLVPTRYQEDVSLGTWVNTQRQFRSKNKLRLDRKLLLDELGFAWKLRATGDSNRKTWHQQYEQLVDFQRKNGNCLVPQKYRKDGLSLGKWVTRQRHLHVYNKLRRDRKDLLDEIGFDWRVKRPRTCPAESEQMAATTNPIGGAIGSPSSVEEDVGRDDEDSKPYPPSYPDQEVVVPEEATLYKIPSGWKRVKLEPDC